MADLVPAKFFIDDHRHFVPAPSRDFTSNRHSVSAASRDWNLWSPMTKRDGGEQSGPFSGKKMAIFYADICITKEVYGTFKILNIFIRDRKSIGRSWLVMLKIPRIVRSCNLHASSFFFKLYSEVVGWFMQIK
jgi:hypothetical protein